ncbi:MAG: NAD(P)H-quinone oxidoreductase [Rhodospirillales bacterium]|nr:NAD(P)H-quinone oxidoreductase [Rhodospirillales bacterium]
MKVIVLPRYGGPEVLTVAEAQKPEPGPDQILVRVRAIGVNRADGLQRQGLYPMPSGISDVPGLELAGEVEALGPGVDDHKVGDRVFGLVAEGAYAEYAVVDHGLAVPIPNSWGFVEGASVIEVFCTANETLFELAGLQAGQSILIHAGGSGVGTAAVQMAHHAGATVYFTAGSQRKINRVLELGGDAGFNYHTHDFVEEVFRATGGEGVDAIEDFIGAEYLMRNIALLRETGCLVLVGILGQPIGDFDVRPMFRKRLRIFGFTLRAQSVDNKRAIVGRFRDTWLPLLAAGSVEPVIHAAVPFSEARRAHEIMEANENLGKVVITID